MSTTPAYHSYISKTFLSTRGARFCSLNNATTKYQRLLSLSPDACMGDLIPELNHNFKGTDIRLSLAFQDSSPSSTQLALQRSSLHQVPLQHELVFSWLHIPPQIWVVSGLTGRSLMALLPQRILSWRFWLRAMHFTYDMWFLFTPIKDWFYYVYKCFVYMYVYMSHTCLVPVNVRRGQ